MATVRDDIFGTVYVIDDEGVRHAFVSGDAVPAWAESKMVDVLADAEPSTAKATAETPAPPSAADADERPPRNGAGSGREAWVTYAASHGVDHAEDASRDEIADAVEAALDS